MKKTVIALAAIAALGACTDTNSADRMESRQTASVTAAAAREVGFPAITNFYEKRLVKEIYERRDQTDLGTFAYVQGLDGKLTCLGRAIGYGVPYSTQFSNPQTDVRRDTDGTEYRREGYAMPQAEPNGLFTPDGLSATWLQLVDAKGDIHVVYVEPTIVVSPFQITGPAVAAGC
jgi:hypothetical protein